MSWRFVALLLLLALTVFASAGSSQQVVEAHALLVRAEPPVNSQVREPPTVLTLYFSEPLERSFSGARVLDQDSVRVDDHVEFDDTDNAVMRIYLTDLKPGFITVEWETVSLVDGHRITGSYPVTILNEDGSLPAGQPVSADSSVSGDEADPGRVVAKWFQLVAAALLTGALGFVIFVSPAFQGPSAERSRSALDRVALLAAVASLAVLAIAGVADLQLQAHDIGVGTGTVLDTRWGERWTWRMIAVALVALATALLFLARSGGLRRLLSMIGLVGCAVFLALVASVSHSAAGDGSFWAASSDFVHLLTASVWIGLLGLMVVLFVYARRLDDGERYQVLAPGLQRFSAVAVVSLALLLFSGAFNAVIEVSRLGDLVDTGYGFTLLLKLLLLLPLLGVGAMNAYVLRPELVAEFEDPGNQRGRKEFLEDLEGRLRRLVRVELGLALVVLAVVAVLVQLTPTRGRLDVGSQSQGKYVESGEQDGISVTLVVDPNEAGINSFEVYLTGAVDVVERVRLNFTRPGTEEARLILEASNPPTFYLGQGPYLATAGDWQIGVDIRRSAGGDILLPFEISVPEGASAAASATASSPPGQFSFPVSLSAGSAALLAVSGVLAVGFVFLSLRRPGLPGGYAGVLAVQVYDHLPQLRPAYSLGLLILAGVGLGLLFGSHLHEPLSKEDASRGNPIEATADSIARGEMLFMNNCTQCHGESGRGDGPLASSLPLPPANLYDHIPYHVDQFFFNVMTDGIAGYMPAFGDQLSEDDRWNILNYLRDRFGLPPPTSLQSP